MFKKTLFVLALGCAVAFAGSSAVAQIPVPDCYANPTHPACKCMEDTIQHPTGTFPYRGSDCTSNDTRIVLVGLGDLTEGCINSDDRVKIKLRVSLNAGANTRYDIGWFIPLDGGNGRTGLCQSGYLTPIGAYGSSTPPPRVAPFADDDSQLSGQTGDVCGEIHPPENPTYYDYTFPVNLPCSSSLAGLLSVPRCTVWANAKDNVCNSIFLTGADNAFNAKCNCEKGGTETDIPAPNVRMSCAFGTPPGGTLDNGESVTNTLTISNGTTAIPPALPQPLCVVPATGTEEFRCGTAGFLRFVVSYNTVHGNVTFTAPGTDQVVNDTVNGRLIWIPRNTALNGTKLGVIGTFAGTRDFEYTYHKTDAYVGQISFNHQAYWSASIPADPKDLTGAIAKTVSGATCSTNVQATPVTVASFDATERDGRTWVEWSTGSETGALGFHVERLDETTGEYLRLSSSLLPAAGHGPGASYRFLDETATPGMSPTYRVVELDLRGEETAMGPFKVSVTQDREEGSFETLQPGFEARPQPRSPRLARGRESAQVRTASMTSAGGVAGQAVSAGTAAKLGVTEDGLYYLSGAQVAALLGMPGGASEAAVKTAGLKLTNRGQDVSWTPSPDGQGILFFGQEPGGVYSRDNVYWLERRNGSRMGTLGGKVPPPAGGEQSFVDTIHVEQNLLLRAYLASSPDEDYWYWEWVFSGNPTSGQRTLALPLSGVARSADEARLALTFRGLTNTSAAPDHRAAIYLNGKPVGEIAWDPDRTFTGAVTFSQELLREGTNEVKVVGMAGNFMIDDMDVTYRRLYRAEADSLRLRGDGNSPVTVGGFSQPGILVLDVTNEKQPVLVTATVVAMERAGTYAVRFGPSTASTPYLVVAIPALKAAAWARVDAPSDLKGKKNGADYLVVTPASLRGPAQALADLRQAGGLRSVVVDLEDVNDEFSFGLASPLALRDFLAYAHANWQPAPRFVLLAGRGTYDYKDFLGLGGNLVPPLLAPSTWGLFPSDNRLADADGDGLPDAAIGRIPAASADELAAYVAKLGAYDSAPVGDWMSRTLMVADNADTAGDFWHDSDVLAGALPPGIEVEKTYLLRPWPTAQARERLLAGLNGGAVLMDYVGHGGLDRLATEGMLTTGDVTALTNQERLPFVTALTCYLNSFAFPGYSPLGEELTLRDDGGAVGVWSATGQVVNSQSTRLAGIFLGKMFDPGERSVGQMVVETLGEFKTTGGDPELIDLYVLLGDPAVILRVAR